MSEFFDGVKQWEFDWKGEKGRLPVFYYDNTTITAIYSAPTRKVKALLPLADMTPAELLPGKSLVAITCFEYRKTDIDPYNEVAISIPMTFRARQIPGLTIGAQLATRDYTAYVWQLPVTTERARVGGVEMYGYPKFLADIDFERSGQTIRCDLAENGEKILALEGKVLTTKRGKVTRYRSFSVMDGIPIVANVYQNPLRLAQTQRKGSARLELGTDHPIAATLRDLELSPDPVVYMYSPVNEAILFQGRNVMDD